MNDSVGGEGTNSILTFLFSGWSFASEETVGL